MEFKRKMVKDGKECWGWEQEGGVIRQTGGADTVMAKVRISVFHGAFFHSWES
jgi:hypothetical protein